MQLAHAAPYRDQWRSVLVAILALVFVVCASGVPGARAAALPATSVEPAQGFDAVDGSGSACTGRPAFKAVIVVGPVGGQTARFKDWADQIASAATAAGMSVCKVYSPYADGDTVKAAAKGADLFVVLMHGNGSPRPDRKADDGSANPKDIETDSRNGLGLNVARGKAGTKYYGADWVRTYLRLAPGAIVVLSHMCYTSGNSEDFDPIPSYGLAVEHVDNFAAGFLDSRSYPKGGHPSVVMALQNQHFDPKDARGNLIDTLMSRNVTLDRAFMSTYTRNTGTAWAGTWLPNAGAIATTDFYVTQRPDGTDLRSRGRIHLDPDLLVEGKSPTWPESKGAWDPQAPDIAWLNRFAGRAKGIKKGSGKARFGYVRAIAGDLSFRTTDWRAGAGEGSGADPEPSPPKDPGPGMVTPATVAIPRIRGLTRTQAKAKLLAAGLKVSTNDLSARSEVVKKGRALNTYPSYRLADGTARTVDRGTVVRIRLSRGPGATATSSPVKLASRRVAIPRVRGLTPAEARKRLEAAGLRVGVDLRIASRTVARGKAVNTYPSYLLDGVPRTVAPGTTVRIKVSTGP